MDETAKCGEAVGALGFGGGKRLLRPTLFDATARYLRLRNIARSKLQLGRLRELPRAVQRGACQLRRSVRALGFVVGGLDVIDEVVLYAAAVDGTGVAFGAGGESTLPSLVAELDGLRENVIFVRPGGILAEVASDKKIGVLKGACCREARGCAENASICLL